MPGLNRGGALTPSKWEKVKTRAFERDMALNAPCHWCGQPIDYSLGMSRRDDYNADAYEADHLKPRKQYPELSYDLANLVPTHAGCNRSRKDRAGINLLGNPSREW